MRACARAVVMYRSERKNRHDVSYFSMSNRCACLTILFMAGSYHGIIRTIFKSQTGLSTISLQQNDRWHLDEIYM